MKLLTSTLLIFRARSFVHRSKSVFTSSSRVRSKGTDSVSEAMADSASTELAGGAKVTLEKLKFVNQAIRSLPVEENQDNYVRSVPGEH